MADVTLLSVRKLVKRFGGLLATDHVDLDVRASETHALIGPNGAGKTTFIAQIQGELSPDEGEIIFGGRNIARDAAWRRAVQGLARSFQITSIFPQFTALTNAVLAVQAQAGHSFRFGRPALDDAALTEPAHAALSAIGLDHRAHVRAVALSHGEQRQLELAMALAMRPKLLLLDEPMAGMGRQDTARMTEILRKLKTQYSMLLVEHDMSAVEALADRVSVLVAGRVVASGSFAHIRADAQVRAAYLGEKHR
ncbi:MAG: branched-chain amino acid transport system ATP-binding protein [Methylobacteriaceae bacterium]|jgi:branched-chain amino acid transport system ATP-binding protein|nr:branched-chain amino acid transport system ATP-binding protein [Methylobacteriaceae bacterium]